jgi:hypothetical protein
LGEPSGSQFAVTVKDCSGPVWIEDCHVKGLSGSFGPSAGIAIVKSASVAVLRSAARGGDSPSFSIYATAGGPGLSSTNSHVDAYDSTFTGGNGGSASYAGHPGGNGAAVNGGDCFLARCGFQGGPGGFGFSIDTNPSFGGSGGAGLAGSGAVSTLNVNTAGGLGGGGTIPGALGPPLALTGSHLPLTGPSFTYAIDSPVKEQQSIVLRFYLDVPAWVVLFLAPDPDPPLFFSGVTGPLLLDPAALAFADFGPFPAGLTTLSIPIGQLPPTVSASTLSTQSVFLDPSLTFVEIGPPSHLLVLDSIF